MCSRAVRRPRQDVLLRRRRMALRRVPRARPAHGADRRRCAAATSPSCSRRASSSTTRPAAQRVGGRVVRQPFPGNIIPPDRISPIAQQLLKYYPRRTRRARQGTQQLLLDQPAHATTSTRSRPAVDHRITRQAARCSSATRATTGASRATAYFGDGERHRADRQLPVSASTTASPPTTSSR